MKALLLLVSAGIMVWSCSKETTDTPEYTGEKVSKTISAEKTETYKTSLDGKSVLWSEGDKVAVFAYSEGCDLYDTDKAASVTAIDGSKAKITAVIKDFCTPCYALYPSTENTAWNAAKGVFVTETASEFSLVAGTFPEKANVSAGKIEEGKVTLSNVLALLKFEISNDDISKVIFNTAAGEALCGTITIDAGTLAVKSVEGSSEVTLVPEGGKTTFAPGVYYLPVPPLEMKDGFYIRLVDSEGFTAKKVHATTYTPTANKIIDLGRQSEWGVDVHVGAVQTGSVALNGNDIVITGNSFRIKYQEESADVRFGIEYSIDQGANWICIESTDGFKTTFDITIPNCIKERKYHVRSWVQYKNDDKAYGEEQILNLITGPLKFDVDFFDYNSEDLENSNFKYIGNDPAWFWPVAKGADGRTIANVEDRFRYVVNDELTVYFTIKNPVTATNGYYFTNTEVATGSLCGWCYRDAKIFLTTPAIPDFKLDKVEILITNNSRQSSMYFSPNTASSNVLGDNGNIKTPSETEQIGNCVFNVAIHKDLSTMGKKKVSQNNTEHCIYLGSNGSIRKIHYTYVPSEPVNQ